MPYQYRIDYRWDRLTDAKGKISNRLLMANHPMVKRGKGGGRVRHGEGEVKGDDGSHLSSGQTRRSVTWADQPHKFRKELGVVGPDCSHHRDVEQEYVSVRKEVEVYLEGQLKGGSGEGRYKVGGQVKEEQQLLHTLAIRLAPIHELHKTEADCGLKESEDADVKPDLSIVIPRNSPATVSPSSSPPGHPNDQHTPLPGSASQEAPHSFAVKEDPTAAFMGKEEHKVPHSEVPLASARHIPPETSHGLPKEYSPAKDPAGQLKPGQYPAETVLGRPKDHDGVSKNGPCDNYLAGIHRGHVKDPCAVEVSGDRAKDPILTVERLSLTQRADKDRKEPELERGFDVIRTVFQQYSDTKAHSDTGTKTSRQAIPHVLSPREAVSTSGKVCRRFVSRGIAGLTPQNPTRPDHLPLNGKPPSPTFQLRGLGTITDGKAVFWKPLVSRLGHDPFLDPSNSMEEEEEEEEEVVEGCTVTHMPSKVILKVVLPRAAKSRQGRLCGRQWDTLGQPPFQAWLSSSTHSPPPPPPSSVPCDGQNDGSNDDSDDSGEDEETDDNGDTQVTSQHRTSHPSKTVLDHPSKAIPRRQEIPPKQPPRRSPSFTDTFKREKHTLADILKGFLPKETKAGFAATNRPAVRKSQTTEGRDKDKTQTATSGQTSVPPLNLGPRMQTADSMSSSHQAGGGHTHRDLSSSFRAAYCDLLGPKLCPDCETARHRQQFTTRQELLYPEISVFPRHLVAMRKLQGGKGARRPSRLPSLTAPASTRWPSAAARQLSQVVSELDMCKRIAEKRQAAKLSMS